MDRRLSSKPVLSTCRMEYKTAIEPWLLCEHVDNGSPGLEEFGYANPNFRVHHGLAVAESDARHNYLQHGEQPNGIDTHYVHNETLSESDATRFKNRSRYAQIESSDMGVPNSPDGLSSPDLPTSDYSISEEIFSNKRERFQKETKVSSFFPPLASQHDTEIDNYERSQLYDKTTSNSRRFQNYNNNEEAFDSSSTTVNTAAPATRNYNGSTQSLIEGANAQHRFRNLDTAANSRLNHLCGVSVESLVDAGTMTANGTGQYRRNSSARDYGQQYDTDNSIDQAVDYRHNDFRTSFQAIEQASRLGGYSPGSAIRVRKEGDTTIVSEHRDPYSFYWGLDQMRVQKDEPSRPEFIQEENMVDELIHDDSAMQIQSPDSHDSGIQVEYVKPSKAVKKLTQQFEEQRMPSPSRKLPHGWERHEDPRGFSYYWHVDSGTITREPPPPQEVQQPTIDRVVQVDNPVIIERQVQLPPQQPVIVERAFKQTTTKRRVENDTLDDRDDVQVGSGKCSEIGIMLTHTVQSSDDIIKVITLRIIMNGALIQTLIPAAQFLTPLQTNQFLFIPSSYAQWKRW